MEEKTINEFDAGTITSGSDAFIFQTGGGITYKLLWNALVSKLIADHFVQGTNITFNRSGTALVISASSSVTYTAGGGINIIGDKISVKPGKNISINSNTGAIEAAGSSYTAGGGIDITGDAISVKLGENLSLDEQTGAINAIGGGTAATIQIGTVTTGEPGTNASVTNSGTSSAAIFNFTIPRGNTGANGTNGNDGSDGYSVSAVTSAITGGHRVTIHSTDPEATDRSFDVMDGVTTIQATSLNIQLTLAAADWTGSTAPYTQTVTMSGMTSSIVPIIGLVPSSTVEAGIEQEKQWGYVTKAESGTDSITFSCYKTKPTVDLTVAVKVV